MVSLSTKQKVHGTKDKPNTSPSLWRRNGRNDACGGSSWENDEWLLDKGSSFWNCHKMAACLLLALMCCLFFFFYQKRHIFFFLADRETHFLYIWIEKSLSNAEQKVALRERGDNAACVHQLDASACAYWSANWTEGAQWQHLLTGTILHRKSNALQLTYSIGHLIPSCFLKRSWPISSNASLLPFFFFCSKTHIWALSATNVHQLGNLSLIKL